MAKRSFDDLDKLHIDPDSSLAIYLWLRGCQSGTSPRASPLEGHAEWSACGLMYQHGSGDIKLVDHHQPSRPFTGALTLEKMMGLSVEHLELLEEQVAQMEVSNNALISRIYGSMTMGQRPFPMIMTSRKKATAFPKRGSSQHRQLILSQAKNMFSISRDPSKCMGHLEPPTSRGAEVLQEYQLQLLMLEQHKSTEILAADSSDSSLQQRPPLTSRATEPSASDKTFRFLSLGPKRVSRRSADGETNHALSDYQTQLVLLEEQNRKRLMEARQSQEKSINLGPRIPDDYQYVSVLRDDSKPTPRKSRTLPVRGHNDRS